MSPHLHALEDDGREADAEEEFIALITTHQKALLAFVLALIPNHSVAEEIVQRTNITLWRKRSEFQLGTSFRAWAFTIARWELRGHARQQQRKSWLVFDDQIASLLADRMASIPAPAVSDRTIALRHCLQDLSPAHQQLIRDRYQLDLSYRKCAERTGRSEAGLRVTLHRLRAILQQCVLKRLKND